MSEADIYVHESWILRHLYTDCLSLDNFDYGIVEQLYSQLMGWDFMTDAESVARGIADRWACIGEDRAVKFLIKEIAAALRDRYDAGYADACRIVHDRADAEGYRRGYEEGSEFQMKMRIRDATERNQEPKCDGECGKECKTCWPTKAGE